MDFPAPPKRRTDRASRLRWEIIAPILAAIFLLGVLLGALTW